MSRSFAVTFDYRCPFARHLHMGLVAGVRDGKDWDLRFLPFSLDQVHVPEGEPAVWERPPDRRGGGVRALEWGIAVRDAFPERFGDFHLRVFDRRHVHGRRFTEETLREAAAEAGLDPDAVAKEVATDRAIAVIAAEHTEAIERWAVFGVPTLIEDHEAAFIRLMRPATPADVDELLESLHRTDLNEFKRTRVPR
ncbi:MAG: DsbA family protein [Chloroflexi bacterium]|nr:DsbA family protein [Chloroflexota bacterium]